MDDYLSLKACINCFQNREIIKFVHEHEVDECDFCGNRDLPACEIEGIVRFIDEGIARKYDVVNGFEFPGHLCFLDVLYDEEILADSANRTEPGLEQALVRTSTYGDQILERQHDGWGSEKLQSIWTEFCAHTANFRFTAAMDVIGRRTEAKHLTTSARSEINLPLGMQDLWFSIENSYDDLITRHDPPFTYFRARVCRRDQKLHHDDLTAPPAELSSHGRMSPIGVSYFYAAGTPETAISELRPHIGQQVAVAHFDLNEPLLVLDLAKERHRKSIFDPSRDEKPGDFVCDFLRTIGDLIAKPIPPEESSTDYVPTQVFCEMIRRGELGKHIAGLRYRSALHKKGYNIVLFRGRDISLGPNPWLTFRGYELYRITDLSVSVEWLSRGKLYGFDC